MTNLINIERGLIEAQRAYVLAVGASDGPYEPRHGRTANWALRHGITETIVRMHDGREGTWEDFPLSERIDPGIAAILGQRLTPLGLALRRHLLENGNG
jgi:hypothetical protein